MSRVRIGETATVLDGYSYKITVTNNTENDIRVVDSDMDPFGLSITYHNVDNLNKRKEYANTRRICAADE